MYNEYELMHHGVKGQKWGVRKQKPVSSKTSSKKGLSKGAKIALGVGAGVLGTAALGGLAMTTGVNPANSAAIIGKTAYKVAKPVAKAAAKSAKTGVKAAGSSIKKASNKTAAKLVSAKKFTKESFKDLKPTSKQVNTMLKNSVNNSMNKIGNKVIPGLAAGSLAYAGKKLVNHYLGDEQAGSYMFSNPNKKD